MFKDAHANYIVAIEGFMGLLKLTADDPKFSAYLKQRLTYLLDRGEKCKQNISG